MKERNMILANIGSGSSYLPDIAEMLIERRDKMPIKEWRLMDIDEYRLNCTGKYVQKMFEDANMPTKIVLTTVILLFVQFVLENQMLGTWMRQSLLNTD